MLGKGCGAFFTMNFVFGVGIFGSSRRWKLVSFRESGRARNVSLSGQLQQTVKYCWAVKNGRGNWRIHQPNNVQCSGLQYRKNMNLS